MIQKSYPKKLTKLSQSNIKVKESYLESNMNDLKYLVLFHQDYFRFNGPNLFY